MSRAGIAEKIIPVLEASVGFQVGFIRMKMKGRSKAIFKGRR